MKKGKKLFSGSPPGGLISKLHYNAKVIMNRPCAQIHKPECSSELCELVQQADLLPLVTVCH